MTPCKPNPTQPREEPARSSSILPLAAPGCPQRAGRGVRTSDRILTELAAACLDVSSLLTVLGACVCVFSFQARAPVGSVTQTPPSPCRTASAATATPRMTGSHWRRSGSLSSSSSCFSYLLIHPTVPPSVVKRVSSSLLTSCFTCISLLLLSQPSCYSSPPSLSGLCSPSSRELLRLWRKNNATGRSAPRVATQLALATLSSGVTAAQFPLNKIAFSVA